MAHKLRFFIDFDGTVVNTDICASMVMKYSGEGWAELNRLWEEGVLSTEECAQRTLDLMEVGPEELSQFFAEFELDPGFKDFTHWAAIKDYPLLILSDGYDNYIEIIQTKYQLNIPYYANHLEYEGGWQFRSCHTNPECQKCGVCKTGILQAKSEPGVINVYIGDGYSDTCAAVRCELVFAKKSLASFCEKEGIAFHHYHNFYDILNKLDEILNTAEGEIKK